MRRHIDPAGDTELNTIVLDVSDIFRPLHPVAADYNPQAFMESYSGTSNILEQFKTTETTTEFNRKLTGKNPTISRRKNTIPIDIQAKKKPLKGFKNILS